MTVIDGRCNFEWEGLPFERIMICRDCNSTHDKRISDIAGACGTCQKSTLGVIATRVTIRRGMD